MLFPTSNRERTNRENEMAYWQASLDPQCPEVENFNNGFWDDPITIESGCGDEIFEAWERKHRNSCERCQQYGCENIEVVY